MSIQSDLLSDVEAFIQQSGIGESTFGKRAVNDGKLVSRLRDQANMTLGTINKVRTYLDAQKAVARKGEAA
jgi:hypothetical protein